MRRRPPADAFGFIIEWPGGDKGQAAPGCSSRSKKMIRKFATVALMAAGLFVAACNTVEGAGKDVSSAGDAVSGAAKDAK